MELNSLGAAREDTHGTPEKLRGKMYSFFCFFFLLSFSFSFTLVPRACHSPTPSAFSATSLPFSTLKETILAPSPSPLAHFSFWNSSAATRVATRRQRGLRRFLSPCSLPPPPPPQPFFSV